MEEELKRLSRSLDRQVYSMRSSRGSYSSSLQSRATLDAYSRFFDEAAEKRRKDQHLLDEMQEIQRRQDALEQSSHKSRDAMNASVQKCLELQMQEKKEKKEKAREELEQTGQGLDSLPPQVLSIYPKIETKSKLSPKDERKKTALEIKKSLEEQIRLKAEAEKSLQTAQRQVEQGAVKAENERIRAEDEAQRANKFDAQRQYKQALVQQMKLRQVKERIANYALKAQKTLPVHMDST